MVGKTVINAMQFKEMNGMSLSTDERRVLERAQTYVAIIILVAGLLYEKDYSKYMKVGITLPNLGPQATRDNILQTATQAEKEGFDSVWTITRILWPLKPQTPYPGTPDGVLPVEYQTAFDPLDVLTYVAGNTTKISLGTSIVNMFFYTPIMLANR
jgi:hypothetical protein